MTILSNPARIGSFTSSEIYKLLSVGSREMTDAEKAAHKALYPKSQKKMIADGFGESALTYIAEKRMERRLGRSIDNESNARALTWGKCCEPIAYKRLGFDYELHSDVTVSHPDYPYWVGSADVSKENTVGDIKCPLTLWSFGNLVDMLYDPTKSGWDVMQWVRDNHKDGDKYYGQLLSNSCIHNVEFAELIVFVPYRSDLPEIRLTASDNSAYRWIEYADDYELPWLIEGGYYQDINIIRFEVPQSDKDLLTNAVIEAGKLLQI